VLLSWTWRSGSVVLLLSLVEIDAGCERLVVLVSTLKTLFSLSLTVGKMSSSVC
jgi:hypothetical protein